jgi:hypothetical protein
MASIRDACLTERPMQSVADWCCENLTFDEAGNHGPYKTAGCEYIIDPLNDWNKPFMRDEVLVWGSQSKKTGMLMGGAAWAAINDPCGFLWVMPSLTLVAKFSRQRWQKMLRRSECFKAVLPVGAKRHDFATASQMLGAATFNFVGSNSPANLASNPCRRVVLDEVDKFDAGGREEADAVNLAEQRTKDQINPQRWKTSTPTLVTGLIWQEYLKGNQMRYFVPCPKCEKEVVFAWSAEYTSLAKTGCEAYMQWDSAAKVNGKWDLEKVEKSARMICPHCKYSIKDSEKTKMVRKGKWKATNLQSSANFVSRHLPSLYATAPETSFGALAVKFLQLKNSLLGLQGFINGELAEPYEGQDTRKKRIDLVSRGVEVTAEWQKLLTVDCQQKQPYFWYVVRAWDGKRSEGIEAGSCDQWEDLRIVQEKHGIKDIGVAVDSGYGARSEADVYKNCARFGEYEQGEESLLHMGWMPVKGFPGSKKWKEAGTRIELPYYLSKVDPFRGTAEAGNVEMSLFEFSGDFYKDILAAMREGKGAIQWAVSKAMDNEEYWRHMDGEVKQPMHSPRTGKVTFEWVKRGRHWPNHLFDCEIIQIALAHFYGWFTFELQEK